LLPGGQRRGGPASFPCPCPRPRVSARGPLDGREPAPWAWVCVCLCAPQVPLCVFWPCRRNADRWPTMWRSLEGAFRLAGLDFGVGDMWGPCARSVKLVPADWRPVSRWILGSGGLGGGVVVGCWKQRPCGSIRRGSRVDLGIFKNTFYLSLGVVGGTQVCSCSVLAVLGQCHHRTPEVGGPRAIFLSHARSHVAAVSWKEASGLHMQHATRSLMLGCPARKTKSRLMQGLYIVLDWMFGAGNKQDAVAPWAT
jgi:hypothetical protein